MTVAAVLAGRLFVIDASALCTVRRLLSSAPARKKQQVFKHLERMVTDGIVGLPGPVLGELERGQEKMQAGQDQLAEWMAGCKGHAVNDAALFASAKKVLEVAPRLQDAEKVSPEDDADPYVLALALNLIDAGHSVTIITDDSVNKPGKTALVSACGAFGVPTIGTMFFLELNGLWPL